MLGEVKFGMFICNRTSLLYNSGEKVFSDRFYSLVCCIVKMMFSVKMVNYKVVDNFFIHLVLKFRDHRPEGLGVIAV